jgi:oxygen-independent coproporphyrinogen-3 oxidase
MKIITEGHSFEDAIRQILQLFFDINTDFLVESYLRKEGNIYTANAKVTIAGKVYEGEEKREINGDEKRLFADLVKKSVFYACKKVSDFPTPWGISTGIRPAKTARMMLDENYGDEEILSYMENEFLVSKEKASLSLKVAKKERELLSKRVENGVSLYVGIPFCPTRCAYCSFVSQAIDYNRKFVDPFTDALIKEIEETARMADELGQKVQTIYFGGGTPSALPVENLDRIIRHVKECFDISELCEFTVEAGRPDTFSRELLSMLSQNGVSRISINPQTMNQKTLDAIGRRHSTQQTINAFAMAREAGTFSINADIIAGLPGESVEDFMKTVREVDALAPDAVTVHTMYLKRAARLIDDFEKLRFASDTEKMVQFSYDYLTQKGYNAYYMYKQRNTLGNLENVAFARAGHESLYNIFIMEEIQTVLAMGGGASTKMVRGDRIERVFNPKEAGDYISRIDEIIERKRKALEFLR